MKKVHMVLYNQFNFIGFEELSSSIQFLSVSLVNIRVVNLPERTETGLVTGSDQTVQTVHSFSSYSSCV